MATADTSEAYAGMVDIHCHVLPGLDDGASDWEQALAMLEMAADGGISDIVATPHANDQFCFDAEAVEERLAESQRRSAGVPRLHYGCELHITPENIESALRFPARYSIAHRGYLLVEFSDFQIPRTAGEILRRLMEAGMRPIIAHPERNPILRERIEDLTDWVEQGALVQVTAHSLLGRFGRSARSSSQNLVERGLVHFLASDAHDARYRPPVLGDARRAVEQSFGQPVADRLLVINPQAVLAGNPVEPSAPARRARFRFFR